MSTTTTAATASLSLGHFDLVRVFSESVQGHTIVAIQNIPFQVFGINRQNETNEIYF